MRGNNKLTLNQETVREAIQYFFYKVVFQADCVPVVVSVEAEAEYGDGGFVVYIKEEEEEPTAPGAEKVEQ